MKEELSQGVTFNQLMAVMGVLVIPLIIWGVRVETRFTDVDNQKAEINSVRSELYNLDKEIDGNYQKLYDLMNEIKLELKDKADR